ncbi:sn-glycerol-3-phosphate import ATP-binding protein UgpC [Biostraticola tofi]|uniref:Glycerol 3-phosphate ABC transporter ATP-binding protein n=1 Tax=Biostraticola tofi TaxID=466109 RepID=A0A4R3YRN2_9GAMM|nr:sn-glycerol-3-phosphate import ATP-binding protein UgpC [Biostraticola tofi]TCV95635.1 glycerol 3-phosphate ABC transporter ATP-binding protein [Biostraticola tofi]
MATLTLQSVVKRYDDKATIIAPLNLEVADGEFIVLVGPSGCGKSTLLRMVAGLENVSSGDIYIDGQRVTQREPKDRGIAMVFQNYALYPHMTVWDNMAYGLKIRGFSKAHIRQRVEDVAMMLELDELLMRKPRELSGGQRQRVAMGRALVREPQVFLFDEPLSNLDAKLRTQMRFELQLLHRRLKTTSLYVTHDQVEAMTLAERVIVMNKGHVEQIGTPTEIYRRPATLFVAGFMGSPAMNLMSGSISQAGDHFMVTGGPAIPLPPAAAQWRGRELTAGIRPEHIDCSSVLTTGSLLEVLTLEQLGADNLVHGRWGDQRVVVRLGHDDRPAPGATLALSIKPDAWHFFDPHSGKRVEL